ncbi:MAG TPA: methylmalonyl Co-A mutase-associated GTPase MeaB [Clostridia bacterium]|nr:methylmalonyl Co-A mutase-associated GTPase MeaB [Clostridia bacterium]
MPQRSTRKERIVSGDGDFLIVQPGVEQPSSLSVKNIKRARRLSAPEYLEGILRGDRAVLGRAITLVESSRPQDHQLAQDLLQLCLPHTGRSIRVGITGVPGAGKSTFIEALGMELIGRGERVAVLAIDPSSQLSRGSILGDKTRMERLASSDSAFIRPSPSAGSLGGVARRTRETMLLCEAAGFRTVFIETVGVGQSETAVNDMVDFFLLLMLAGAGDELQGIKRGIMEMSDLIAINKADGENTARARLARCEYETALHLFAAQPSGWTPKVVTCSALSGSGIAEIWDTVLEHQRTTRANGYFEIRRRTQVRNWMQETIEQGLLDHFRADPRIAKKLPELETEVAAGRLTSARAAEILLDVFRRP